MKSLFLSIFIIFSISASAQKVCNEEPVLNCWDTEGHWYVLLAQTFVNKYQNQKKGVNQFFAVQTCNGCWVTSTNAIAEFPEFFKEFNNEQLNANIVWLPLCNFQCGGGGGGTPTPTAYSTLKGNKAERPNVAFLRMGVKMYVAK